MRRGRACVTKSARVYRVPECWIVIADALSALPEGFGALAAAFGGAQPLSSRALEVLASAALPVTEMG